MQIWTRRIYDSPTSRDGARILFYRVWKRRVSKPQASQKPACSRMDSHPTVPTHDSVNRRAVLAAEDRAIAQVPRRKVRLTLARFP